MEQKVSSILTEIFMFDEPKIIVNKTFPILSTPSQDGPGTPNIYHNSYQIPHTLHIQEETACLLEEKKRIKSEYQKSKGYKST